MSYNQNSGYGQALLNMVTAAVPVFGRVLIVMNSANTDEENYTRMQDVFPPDTNGQVQFFTSLASAYSAAESNNNDVILLDSNSSLKDVIYFFCHCVILLKYLVVSFETSQ